MLNVSLLESQLERLRMMSQVLLYGEDEEQVISGARVVPGMPYRLRFTNKTDRVVIKEVSKSDLYIMDSGSVDEDVDKDKYRDTSCSSVVSSIQMKSKADALDVSYSVFYYDKFRGTYSIEPILISTYLNKFYLSLFIVKRNLYCVIDGNRLYNLENSKFVKIPEDFEDRYEKVIFNNFDF